MPHDKNGRLVSVGDKVILRGEVKEVHANPDYCNCSVQSPYLPPEQMGFHVTCCTQEIEPDSLTFRQLAQAAAVRLLDFKDRDGNPVHDNICGTEWSPLEWAGAMCGEAGEAANICKKLRRGDVQLDTEYDPGTTTREAIAKELADTVCYAEALARRGGIDLGEAIRQKFNAVSERIGSKVRL